MRILILASGRGTNACAIIKAVKIGAIKASEVCAVISDIADAPVLGVEKDFGVAAKYIDPQRKGARFSEQGEIDYLNAMKEINPDLVVLAGFMRILPPSIVSEFKGKMINLHPSLLPLYKGKDAIKRAYEAGDKQCGCTVHFVSDELDGGRIIAQKAVAILPTDTLETLEQKVHEAEHELLPQVIADFACGKIKE